MFSHNKLKLGLSTLLALLATSLTLQAEEPRCLPQSEKVARALFTTKVANREPTDRVLVLENNISELFFFSDLRHLQGQTVHHRWEYEGQVVHQKSFVVKGPRWRVYSKGELPKDKTGRWTALVTDNEGCPLKAVVFQYIATGEVESGAAILKLD